jgi:hypothetical protein
MGEAMKPFFERNMGNDVEDAFRGAVKMARLIHGEGNGSLADKTSYLVIEAPENLEAQHARALVQSKDSRFDHPSKPAGAVKLAHPEWLFFGWA